MRGMNARLVLKEKTDGKVIYCYSADSSTFSKSEVLIDGEIECTYNLDEPETFKCRTLKKATNDEDGGQAKWLYEHLWGVVFKENCPAKRLIATG